MPSIKYGTTIINFCQYKHKRNDIKISVDLVNGVEVYAPDKFSDEKIREIVKQKANWIIQKLEDLNEVKITVPRKEFISGEKLPYLGRQYRLKVHRVKGTTANIGLKQGKFIAEVPFEWVQDLIQSQLKKQLIHWYRERGLKKLLERATYYQGLLGVKPTSIKLRTQHKRWGSCTPNGDIYINWRIVMAPIRVIDYIIVHELTHLIVPEHNEQFWRTVRTTFPHYQEAKEWLRVNGVKLHCI